MHGPVDKTGVHPDQAPPSLPACEGPPDSENPRDWSSRKKLTATALVSLLTFTCPLTSTMVAPALPIMSSNFGVESEVERELMLSAFILGYLVGPVIHAPLSEVFGRAPVLNTGNLTFLAFNLACGFAQTFSQMVVLRFFSGLGGIASLTCGSGLLSDCWDPEQRARVWAFYILMPLIGPSIGPIIGSFIAEYSSWRWMFWSTSIFDAVLQVACFLLLEETYAPQIQRRRIAKLRKQADAATHQQPATAGLRVVCSQIWSGLRRPIIMLLTEPILQVMTVYSAYLYGVLYLLLATFPEVWAGLYHESNVGIAGLNYFSLTVGFAVGEFATAIVQDFYYKSRVKKTPDKKGQPEFRLPILIPEALLLPVGLLWYGWSVQAKTHWIMPNIGVAIATASLIGSSQLVTLYVVDSFETFTASAISGQLLVRFLAGFAFPLFAPDLNMTLGWGWANSLLALIAIAIGIPSATLLLIFGGKLRMRRKAIDHGGV